MRIILALLLLLSGAVYADGPYTRSRVGATTTTSGGSTSPGSPVNSVQYNNAGAFGGDAGLLYDATNDVLSANGVTATALSINMAAGGSNRLQILPQGAGGSALIRAGQNNTFLDWQSVNVQRLMQLNMSTSGAAFTVSVPTTITSTLGVSGATVLASGTMINSSTAPTSALQVLNMPTSIGTGTVCVTSSTGVFSYTTSVCATSSRVFKENVHDLSNGLALVNALEPVTFTYKPEFSEYGSGPQLGFIAEDVNEIIPAVVGHFTAQGMKGLEDGTPYMNVDYSRLTAPLVGAVQELSAKVDALQQRVQQLESR